MKNTEYSQLQTISNYYFDPNRAMRLMLNLVKSKEKYTKKVLQRIYLQRLTERGLGTTEVEVMDSKVVRGQSKRDEKTIVRMMRRKVKDALNEEKRAKCESVVCRREYRENIVQSDFGNDEFENVAKQIVERLWYVKMIQIRKGVEEKKNLYKVGKYVNDVEGIRIANNNLTENEKEPIENKPVVYDNIEITDDMKAALTLPPGSMLYGKIDMEEIETEFEKGLVKARYCLMSKDENENGRNEEVADTNDNTQEPKTFDIVKGKVDLSLMKVTDIPTVRRLLPPKPAKIQEETYLLNTKRLLMKTAKEYVEKNCNKKGEVKVKNISKAQEKGMKEIEDEIKKGNSRVGGIRGPNHFLYVIPLK